MSIIIKGMKMPEACIDCPFMVSRENDDCILQSEEANAKFENWDDMRRNCPLIEIPPHGRLIDADALMKDIIAHDYLVTDCFNTRAKGMFTFGIRYAITEAAPTILDSDNNVPCKEEVKE